MKCFIITNCKFTELWNNKLAKFYNKMYVRGSKYLTSLAYYNTTQLNLHTLEMN